MENDEGSQPQYLSIRNWEKFQPKLKSGHPSRPWFRVDANRIDDDLYASLTFFERGVLTGIMEYTARSGRWPRNDSKFIARALRTLPKESHCIPQAIRKLTALGFLALCNQCHSHVTGEDKTGQDMTGETKKESPEPKPSQSPFEVPSLRDVTEYMEALGCVSESKNFVDYYQSKGWIVGKTLMNDWQAAARRWQQNEFTHGGRGNGRETRFEKNRSAEEEFFRRRTKRDNKTVPGLS